MSRVIALLVGDGSCTCVAKGVGHVAKKEIMDRLHNWVVLNVGGDLVAPSTWHSLRVKEVWGGGA